MKEQIAKNEKTIKYIESINMVDCPHHGPIYRKAKADNAKLEADAKQLEAEVATAKQNADAASADVAELQKKLDKANSDVENERALIDMYGDSSYGHENDGSCCG